MPILAIRPSTSEEKISQLNHFFFILTFPPQTKIIYHSYDPNRLRSLPSSHFIQSYYSKPIVQFKNFQNFECTNGGNNLSRFHILYSDMGAFQSFWRWRMTDNAEASATLGLLKLDGVGPVDNRPSTDQLHHFITHFFNFFFDT